MMRESCQCAWLSMMICTKLLIDTELSRRVRSLPNLYQVNRLKTLYSNPVISIACNKLLRSRSHSQPPHHRNLHPMNSILSIWEDHHSQLLNSNSLNQGSRCQPTQWHKWWEQVLIQWLNQCQTWWLSRCKQPWPHKCNSRCLLLDRPSQIWWRNKCKRQWPSVCNKCSRCSNRLSHNNLKSRNQLLRRLIQMMLLPGSMKY